MRVVLSLPADAESCWLELLRAALPGAQVSPRLWGKPVDPKAMAADYVVAYGPCDTLFDEQRRMKAIFTLSAGVGHLLKMPNVPRDVPIIRLEDAGMAEHMVRYVLAAALRFLQRLDVYARQQRDEHPKPGSVQQRRIMGDQIAFVLLELDRGRQSQGRDERGDDSNRQSQKQVGFADFFPILNKPGGLDDRFNAGVGQDTEGDVGDETGVVLDQ